MAHRSPIACRTRLAYAARAALLATWFGSGPLGLGCEDRPSAATKACPGGDCPSAEACRAENCVQEGDRPLDRPAGSRDHWRRGGPGGDRPVPRGPGTQPRLVWDLGLGAPITARPAIPPAGDPLVLVGTHAGRFVGVVVEGEAAGTLALDLTLPGIIWGTAAVDHRNVAYVGADDDVLYAIDLSTKAIRWQLHVGSCDSPRAAGPEGSRCDPDGGPTIDEDGELYLGADGVYRIGPDGTIRWHWPPDGRARHVATAPALSRDGRVYVGGQDGSVTALDRTGVLLWQYAIGADVDGAPAIGRDGTVYVAADDGRVYGLTPDGRLQWSVRTGGDIRSAVALDGKGRPYAASLDGNVYALDVSGRIRWVFATAGPVASSPILDEEGNVFFGSRDDYLYGVANDGTLMWRLDLPADVDSTVAVAPGGVVVVGCDDGHLRAFR